MAGVAPALAQAPDTVPASAPVASGQIYEPSFFERFAPSTALDMIRNIPGFTLTGGEDRRGFGQGGANVIINGRRVSGKSSGTIDALSRVTAASVVRIEIVDGASLSLPGLSGQVANVITEAKGISGRWRWNPQARTDTRPVIVRGDASLSGENGPVSWTVGAHVYGGRGSAEGPEWVTDINGDLIDLRQERGWGGGYEPGFNTSLTWLGRRGDVLNLNATMKFPDFENGEDSFRSGPGQPDREWRFRSDFSETSGEVGADYEFDLWGGRLKLIGMVRGEDGGEVSSVIETYADMQPDEGGRFKIDYESGERIARAEYAFPSGGGGGEWQAAVEGAFNFLEATTLSETLTGPDVFTPDGSPDTTRVEEKRAEASLTYTRKLADGLDLQATLAGEYSEISQSGVNGLTREFVRPKGFVSLAWNAAPDLDFNFRLERRVGQLDFGDFAASSNLSDGTSQSGNVQLVPEQSWVFETEANRRMGAWGAVKLKAYASAIEDVVDQVPIYFCDGQLIPSPADCADPTLFRRRESVGNIDKAERYGVSIGGTLNFDPIGFEGAKLEYDIGVNESRVTDPFTGEDRRISRTRISNINGMFRHDIPDTSWAWGIGQERFLDGPRFRMTQSGQFRVKPAFTFYFIEHKDVFGAKVWFQYMPSGPRETFTRDVYVDGRDNPLTFSEYNERKFGDIFRLTVTKSF